MKPEPGFVYVNHGRWVADCDCGSASIVTPAESSVVCGDCRELLELVWPADLDGVWRLLEGRRPVNRNWWPWETLDGLRFENEMMGVS